MLQLYNPATGANITTAGQAGVSTDLLMLNILIELRVMNAIAMDMQRGVITETPAQYRQDVVNGTVNPVI